MNRGKKGPYPIDTLAITESLGLQTFRGAVRRSWSKAEDSILMRRLQQLYPAEWASRTILPANVDWELVSDAFSDDNRKPRDCRKRWTCSLDPGLRRGKWTELEDELLLMLYKKHGPLWQHVALEIEGRTEHQCSKRYLEVLDPALRNRLKPWTEAEDMLLIRQVKEHGTKWKTIAGAFDARPSLTCRNRWRKLVTSVARGRADPMIMEEMSQVVDGDLRTRVMETLAKTEEQDGVRDDEDDQLGGEETIVKPLTASITAEPVSEVEWKYSLEAQDDSLKGPLQQFVDNGGVIKSQKLAQILIDYAAQHGMKVTVHQHLHHHYPEKRDKRPKLDRPVLQHSNSQKLESFSNSLISSQPRSFGQFDQNLPAARYYPVEPETQFNRSQHFHYLPPLTEVPKLNSSASSPAGSSKDGSTHYHHHHHHHHHHHDEQGRPGEPISLEEDAASKESDLIKLLNQTDSRARDGNDDKKQEPRSNSMTPLAQAVQLAASEEFLGVKRSADGYPEGSRKHKGDEEEEGLDFWETVRNLNDIHQKGNQMAMESVSRNASSEPVSQHHPLHYFASGVTPQPENRAESEEEEEMNTYGLFYNLYRGDTSIEQQNGILDINNTFGAFPFNPS